MLVCWDLFLSFCLNDSLESSARPHGRESRVLILINRVDGKLTLAMSCTSKLKGDMPFSPVGGAALSTRLQTLLLPCHGIFVSLPRNS